MKVRYKLVDVCFYLFWFFLQVGKGLGYTSRHDEFTILLIIAVPFGLTRMFLMKWDMKSLMRCVLLNVLGLAIALVTKTTTYLLSIFCITAIAGADIRKALKVVLLVRGPLFVIRTTAAILGFLDMEVSYRYVDGVISVMRYALGYGNPNTTQFELFMLIMVAFFLYKDKLKIFHYILALAYTWFIFTYTDSKTAFYLGLLFICATFACLIKGNNLIRQLAVFVSSKSWAIGIIFTVIGCMLYLWLPSFRGLGTFASRFLTATNIISTRSLPLLGHTDVVTDLGYVYILYNGGIILAVLFLTGMNSLQKKNVIRQDIILCLAFACFSVFNIMETYTYSVLSNPMLLFLAYVVYPKMNGNYKVKKVNENPLLL